MSAGKTAGETVRCVVGLDGAGQRLDRFLAMQSFLPTRSRIAFLIRGGHVSVDGVARKTSYPVSVGNVVEIFLPPEEPSWVEPEDLPLDVLFEDEAKVVIAKPAGMASHPAPGTRKRPCSGGDSPGKRPAHPDALLFTEQRPGVGARDLIEHFPAAPRVESAALGSSK